MRVKNLRTGLEGQVCDLERWGRIMKETPNIEKGLHYCRLKDKACKSSRYKECAYLDTYKIIPDEK